MSVRRYYRTGDVVRITGATRRQLAYWIERGIIRASGRNDGGRGNVRLFTFRDVVEVRAAKRLIDCGLKLNALRGAVLSVRRRLPEYGPPLTTLRLLTNGTDVFSYYAAPDVLLNLTQFGQFAFAFGLDSEIRGVMEEIDEQRKEREMELRQRRAAPGERWKRS